MIPYVTNVRDPTSISRGKNQGYGRIDEDVLYPHLARQENKFLAYSNTIRNPAGNLLAINDMAKYF